MADEKKTVILDFQVDSDDATVSIQKLTAANKALREERKKVDLSTEEGVKRIKDINKAIDENDKVIKNNSSSLEKQRLNVGNYAGALDKLVPGLGATIEGFKGMASSAMAFIATPIGAVIAALGLAIGSLKAYFKGSEEGQDAFAKAMNIGKVIMEAFIQVVEKLGEIVFKTLSFIGDLAMSALDAVAPAVSQMLNDTIAAADQITQLQDEIEARENELTVKRAKTSLEVAKLREQAIQQEGAAKRALIEEAIALEKKMAEEETFQAEQKLLLLQAEIEATGAATEEQKAQLADATAFKIEKEAEAFQSTLRFQKELEKLREEDEKVRQEQEKKRAEEEKRRSDERIIRFREEKNAIDALKKLDLQNDKDIQKQQDELNNKAADSMRAAQDKIRADIEQTKLVRQKELEFERAVAEARMGLLNQLGGTISALAGKNKEAAIAGIIIQKGAAIAQIIASTGIANAKAVAVSPLTGGLPWTVINTISAGLSITKTIAEAAKGIKDINSAKGFKQGGYTGDGNPDDVAGVTHRGEFVMPANVVSQFGKETFQSFMDGSVVANGRTGGMKPQQTMEKPVVYLNYTEFRKFQDEVQMKEAVTTT